MPGSHTQLFGCSQGEAGGETEPRFWCQLALGRRQAAEKRLSVLGVPQNRWRMDARPAAGRGLRVFTPERAGLELAHQPPE